MRRILLASAAMATLAIPAGGKTIERACLSTGKQAATRTLCGCVQDVADLTLSRSDQRRAAKFFDDPQKAQDVRMSRRAQDDAFWDRYSTFGEAAQTYCANS